MSVKHLQRYIRLFALLLVLFLVSCHGKDGGKKPESTVVAADSTSADKKIDELTIKLKANPKNADLYHERAMLYLSLKNLNASLADMNQAMMMDSFKAPYYLTIADIYFSLNKTRFSKEALEKCIKLDPKNVQGYLKLAELYLFVQDYKKTIEYIDAALKIDINNPRAYFMKGMTFKEMKDTAKTISSFRTAIEQNPKYYEAYMELGLVFSSLKDDLALQYLTSAISLRANSIEAYYARGLYLQERGDLEKAVQDYAIILQLDPKYKNAHYNLGYINYVYLKNNEKAIRHFTDAIDCDAKYAEAYYMRGLSYEGSGNNKFASLDYKKALSLNPEYELASKGLQRVGK